MMKEYLVSSTYRGYYSTGFHCVEVVSEEDYRTLQRVKNEGFEFTVYEWEGKHSENTFSIDDNDFVLVTDDQEYIQNFKLMFGSLIGTFSFADEVLERYNESQYEEESVLGCACDHQDGFMGE